MFLIMSPVKKGSPTTKGSVLGFASCWSRVKFDSGSMQIVGVCFFLLGGGSEQKQHGSTDSLLVLLRKPFPSGLGLCCCSWSPLFWGWC